VNEYWFGPVGVATTIPAPRNGNGSRYFISLPAALLAAAAIRGRIARGNAKEAPIPSPYCRK
jgi:hypothetical protein